MARLQHSTGETSRPSNGRATTSAPLGPTGSRPVRLLLVDDEISIREVTAAILSQEGYEILTAADGLQALELLRRFHPDVLVTDLRMPGMSGMELVKIVRKQFPRLPVIIVSGDFNGDQPPPGVIADAFLPKGGFYIQTLGEKISELLSADRTS